MLVQVKDVTARLPESVLPLSDHDATRVELFLRDAEQVIEDAFLREGRVLEHEILSRPWLGRAVVRVVQEMVAASIIVGGNVNVSSASSSTGQESDSVSYRATEAVSFAGPRLTDELRKELGLSVAVRSRGRFPCPPQWPEVRLPRWR